MDPYKKPTIALPETSKETKPTWNTVCFELSCAPWRSLPEREEESKDELYNACNKNVSEHKGLESNVKSSARWSWLSLPTHLLTDISHLQKGNLEDQELHPTYLIDSDKKLSSKSPTCTTVPTEKKRSYSPPRVTFAPELVSEVMEYQKANPEELSEAFYSKQELQRMWDDCSFSSEDNDDDEVDENRKEREDTKDEEDNDDDEVNEDKKDREDTKDEDDMNAT